MTTITTDGKTYAQLQAEIRGNTLRNQSKPMRASPVRISDDDRSLFSLLGDTNISKGVREVAAKYREQITQINQLQEQLKKLGR